MKLPIAIHAEPGLAATRREAMKWMAASLALAGAGCSRPAERIYSAAAMPEIAANGSPIHYATQLVQEGYGLGVLVGTQSGRPIKIEGHAGHPSGLGGSNAQAQAAVLQLWDPDRLQTVLRHDGPVASIATWADFAAAWADRPGHGNDGQGLALLTGRFTSPCLQAQLASLLQALPGARWHRCDGADTGAAQRGAALAFGRALQPVFHFQHPALIVAFGADPFAEGPGRVRHAADWAQRRASDLAAGRVPPRLVALETTPALFGARADERWACTPAAIEQLLQSLAARWLGGSKPVDADASGAEARLAELLPAFDGRLLLVGGEALSDEGHARLHALNQRFGSLGRSLELIVPPEDDGPLPAPATLAQLLDAIDADRVNSLLILDSNAAQASALAPRFAQALGRVPWTAYLGLHRDETAKRCQWQLPMSHGLECWGDARSHDGSSGLIQPAIAPLYDTRSAHELIALITPGETLRDGHALLRRYWRAHDAAGDDERFETFWRETLRRGHVPHSASAAQSVPHAQLPSGNPAAAQAGTLWGMFPPDASVGDGRHANSAWLQELPRPFTKLTWDNVAQLGPRTAARLGVETGDGLLVTSDDGRAHPATIEIPAFVQPGHAEEALTLALGYGRSEAGRIGNGIGVDVGPLRGARPGPVKLRAEPSGRRHTLALTQVELDDQGRAPARRVAFANAFDMPDAAAPQPSLYPPVPHNGPAWGMVIDLDACIGCNVCTIACQAENNIPVVGADQVTRGRAMHWIRVDHYIEADGCSNVQPVPCMHCENAPCELVCPVGATVHDSEGLNLQVYNRCVGTRFCSNNCPYKVRRFNFLQYAETGSETAKAANNPDVTVRSRGVMEKCSYCVQRISRARRDALKQGHGVGGDDVVTACQGACPTQAIHFGNIDDATSDVAAAKRSPRHYALLEELGTRPRTTYLARIDLPAFKKEGG